MKLNISNDKKIEITTKALLEQEALVYESIIKAGYSPEDFDEVSFVVDENADDLLKMQQGFIYDNLQRYKNMKDILESLS